MSERQVTYFHCPTANRVLSLCEQALFELESGAAGEAWLLRWFGLLAALRAVGHVLKNVDAYHPSVAPQIKYEIDEAWKALKRAKSTPAHIFHHFIEEERNSLLKELRFNAELRVAVASPRVSYVIHDGPFKGREALEVAKEAVEFWRQYIRDINIRAAARHYSVADSE